MTVVISEIIKLRNVRGDKKLQVITLKWKWNEDKGKELIKTTIRKRPALSSGIF